MAITGSGTQVDPYLVHNYDELKEACQYSLGNTNNYVKLDQDIDCEEYGAEWEWEAIDLDDYDHGRTGTKCNLNLGGHTIKNVILKKDNYMFGFSSQSAKAGRMENGCLLNVFVADESSKYVIAGSATSRLSQGSAIENLSISVHLGVNAEGAIKNTYMKSCAIYVEAEGGTNDSIFQAGSYGREIQDCDFLVNIPHATSALFGLGTTPNYCRIRGSFYSASNINISRARISACVFDLDTNSNAISSVSSNTGVVNSDKVISNFDYKGMTPVDSQEIINGDALRANGFNVTNVEG